MLLTIEIEIQLEKLFKVDVKNLRCDFFLKHEK